MCGSEYDPVQCRTGSAFSKKLTAAASQNTAILTLEDVTNVVVGMNVYIDKSGAPDPNGAIPAYTTVNKIAGTKVTLSKPLVKPLKASTT